MGKDRKRLEFRLTDNPGQATPGRKGLYFSKSGALGLIDYLGNKTRINQLLPKQSLVVDPDGNGDYTSLDALLEKESGDLHVTFVGESSVGAELEIPANKYTFYLTNECVVDFDTHRIRLLSGCELNVFGPGKMITNSDAGGFIYEDEPDPGDYVPVDRLLTIGMGSTIHNLGKAAVYCPFYTDIKLNTCTLICGTETVFEINATNRMTFPTLFNVTLLGGTWESISAGVDGWDDAEIYYCYGELSNYKVSTDRNNYTNVFGGVFKTPPFPWIGELDGDFNTSQLYGPGYMGYNRLTNELQVNVNGEIRSIPTNAL